MPCSAEFNPQSSRTKILTKLRAKLIIWFVSFAKGTVMAQRPVEPLTLLLRHQDPEQLLTFFQAIEEGFTAAFADANTMMPASSTDRPAINARGAVRRVLMDRAFRAAAAKAGLNPATGFTSPPSWSFPVLRLGPFSITVGLVEKIRAVGPRRLRNRSKYIRHHSRNNDIANPQENLFRDYKHDVPRVLPSGILGALVVAEASPHQPDMPLWIGFWLPSPNLRQAHYRCSFDELLAFLREHQITKVKRTRPAANQRIERKNPVLKPMRKRKPREE